MPRSRGSPMAAFFFKFPTSIDHRHDIGTNIGDGGSAWCGRLTAPAAGGG